MQTDDKYRVPFVVDWAKLARLARRYPDTPAYVAEYIERLATDDRAIEDRDPGDEHRDPR